MIPFGARTADEYAKRIFGDPSQYENAGGGIACFRYGCEGAKVRIWIVFGSCLVPMGFKCLYWIVHGFFPFDRSNSGCEAPCPRSFFPFGGLTERRGKDQEVRECNCAITVQVKFGIGLAEGAGE